MELKLGSSYPRLHNFRQIAPQATTQCKVIVKVAISYGSLTHNNLGYVWFPENLKENVRKIKYKGKVEGKKKWRKIN